MVKRIYLFSFVETPRKFTNSNSPFVSTDEDPSLRIEGAITNLRGASTKFILFTAFKSKVFFSTFPPFIPEHKKSNMDLHYIL